jgi:choline dehydrogenase-like flavoprotein
VLDAVEYDAIIVGSGPTGGYAAKALCAAGMQVLVLDAGRRRSVSDAILLVDRLRRKLGYVIEEDPAAVARQPVQSGCYAWPHHPHAFVDDADAPYLTEAGQPFAWIRSRQVGGRMLVRRHGLQFYRFSDLDFKAGDRDGASPSWPMSYEDLAPYYERVERWMGLQGSHDGIAHLPDSILTGDKGLNAGERILQHAVERRWSDRRLIPCRTAPPPFPLADAVATRRCTLRADAVVRHIAVDGNTANAKGVEYVDRATGRGREAKGKTVILCASSIESARLLLASATRQHPHGLGNSSDAVGRHLMDHTHLSGIRATMPLSDPVQTSSWAYIPRFQNLGESDRKYARGFGVQVFTMWRECALTAFGEMLPHPDNRVTLDRDKTDKWGVPLARISCVHRGNELAMVGDEIDACREMLSAANFDVAPADPRLSVPGLANHEVGTARMGTEPKRSVLNGFCQSWDVKNLFVMDGSCFVSQGVQNPTLTMLAITARSCDYLIDSYRRGTL